MQLWRLGERCKLPSVVRGELRPHSIVAHYKLR